MKTNIKSIIDSNIKVSEDLLCHLDTIEEICLKTLETINSGNKILLCGNGGSASDSIHISSEIVGKFEKTRKALPAISLSTNPSHLTAIANDFGFDYIFSRQIEAIGDNGDLLIAISTSGNSNNVIKAIDTALIKNLNVIILTGNDGGAMNNYQCLKLKAPSDNVARIQEVHILTGHIISKYLEDNLDL